MVSLEGVPTIVERALEEAREGAATSDIEMIGDALVLALEHMVTTQRAQLPPVSEREYPTRGKDLKHLAKAETSLGLPQRPDTDFKHHADWENYLSGRADAARIEGRA